MFDLGMTRWMTDEEKEYIKQLKAQVGFNPDSEEAVKMVKEATQWIQGQEVMNDYMHNLKVASSCEYTNFGRMGLLVSLFPTFNRELEVEALRRKEAEQGKLSEHVGQIGDRLQVDVESVKCLTSWESCFNGYTPIITYIWKIVGKDGNVYTWKTSKWLNEEVPPKAIKGTVKEHKVFREVSTAHLYASSTLSLL